MKKRFYGFLCGLALMPSISQAENLMQVYQQALVHDPVYQGARAAYLAATEAYPQARSALLPLITLSGQWRETRQNLKSSFAVVFAGTNGWNTSNYTLQLTQPIVNFAAFSQIRVARATVKQASAVYAAAGQALMNRVTKAYFAVLQAQDILRYTHAQKLATARQLDQAQQRFKVGIDPITSVLEAQSSYDRLVAQEIGNQNAVINSKEALRQITDHYYNFLAPLKTNYPLYTPHPNNVERWVNAGVRQNMNIMAARFAADAAKQTIDVKFEGHLPTISGVASTQSMSSNDDATSVGNPQTYSQESIGLQLNLPIYQGGFVNSQTRQAEYVYQQAIAQQELIFQQVTVQIRQAFNSVIAGISQIQADKQTIIAQQSTVDSTEEAVKVGTRTLVDLLIAQQNLFIAQGQLAIDQYAYINNLLLLKNLAGTLNIHDLEVVSFWLNNNATQVTSAKETKLKPQKS